MSQKQVRPGALPRITFFLIAVLSWVPAARAQSGSNYFAPGNIVVSRRVRQQPQQRPSWTGSAAELPDYTGRLQWQGHQ